MAAEGIGSDPGLVTLGQFNDPSAWPELRIQVDPNDFLVPQVFDPEDERRRSAFMTIARELTTRANQ